MSVCVCEEAGWCVCVGGKAGRGMGRQGVSARTHGRTHARTHAWTHARMDARMQHACMHARMHACTHAETGAGTGTGGIGRGEVCMCACVPAPVA